MNDAHESLLDDVALLALGVLPSAEAVRVRAHLRECSICRDEYQALLPAVAAVGQSAEAAPSDLLRARIMRSIKKTPARPQTSGAYFAAAACLLVALGLGAYNLKLVRSLHSANDRVATLEAQQSGMSHALQTDQASVDDLSSDRAKRYPIHDGQVIRVGNKLYLAMHDLPALAPGKVFQAWSLPKGGKTMQPLPTFVANTHGSALVLLPVDASTTSVVAVSVEPRGGSRAPTSKPLVVQALD